MKFFERTKGVISIFLIIIMLPLFTSAVLLVDGTRYHSAKTIIQEAGDLAAYSTIANYDVNLKDEYGLIAFADVNVNESFNKYFKDSLGNGSSGGSNYSDQIQDFISSSVFRGGNYKDVSFFNLYNFNVESANAVGMYPLSEPGVLQNQIVEYSKYRGVETLLERFEILSKFDKIDEETKASQDTLAAVENLSSIEEGKVTNVSGAVKNLRKQVENYDAALSDLLNLIEDYRAKAANEIASMAVNSSNIYEKKQERINAYQAVEDKLNSISAMSDEINNSASSISAEAQQAIDDLNTFKSNHSGQQDACKTADEDISMLNSLLEQKETKYSLWYLKQNISPKQTDSLSTDVNSKIDMLNHALQTTYTNYQTERNNAEDTSTVRYHFTLKSGTEWFATSADNTAEESSRKESDYISSAGVAVKEYVGEVNSDSYKAGFKNIFEDTANERAKNKPTDNMSAKDAAEKSNSSKKDKEKDVPQYKTISGVAAAELPSRCAGEQSEMNIPDFGEQSASAALSTANSNSMDILSKFAETGRNDVLTYCYLLDNFKTRVTAKGINKNTQHSGIPERNLVDWRYSDARGELDMRYRAKQELQTFFYTNEVEYVFGGSKSELANAAIVYSWIYGTRFANNFIAVYSAYNSGDSWIRYEIDALAAAASAATVGAVPFTVFKWVFMTSLAAGETALDLALLIDDGYRIPLIKTKDNLFIQKISDIDDAFSFKSRLNYMKNPNSTSNLTDKINVSYEDYLIILLAFVDRDTRLKRIADLIQMNMQERGQTGFKMSEANTYVKADTAVSIKYMFQPISQFKDSYNGTGIRLSNTIYQGY